MLLAGTPALATDCGPLREMASLAITPVSGSSRMAASVAIDGHAVHLLLDTGAGASGLTRAAAGRLHLRMRNSSTAHLLDADGHAVHRYFVTDSLQVGTLSARRIPFLLDAGEPDSLDGTFGPDLMLRYDVEMDFAEGRLRLFSQDHCQGHVVHWRARPVAQIPIVLRLRARDYPPPMPDPAAGSFDFIPRRAPVLGTDIRTTVVLDGQEFTANIDTGSDFSTINSDVARAQYGSDRDVPGAAPDSSDAAAGSAVADTPSFAIESVTVTGRRAMRRFHTLMLGGVTVTNPAFALRPPLPGESRAYGPREPDITIGMNILSKLHLYFAFKERILYVSPAEPAPGGEWNG
jgi:hypothetical protein